MNHHERGRRDRRHDRIPTGPTPADVQEALEGLLDHAIPGTPRVSDLRTLEAAGISAPVEVHERTVKEWAIQHGDPQHGAMRSDDHVKAYEVEYVAPCPECDSTHLRYEYDAYHHIAGSMRHYCPVCDHTLEEEEWS